MPYTYSLKVIFCHTFSAPGFRGPLVKWKEMWGFIFIFIFLPIVLCWHSESFGFGGTYDFWFFRFGIPKLSSWWWAWEPPMGLDVGSLASPLGNSSWRQHGGLWHESTLFNRTEGLSWVQQLDQDLTAGQWEAWDVANVFSVFPSELHPGGSEVQSIAPKWHK